MTIAHAAYLICTVLVIALYQVLEKETESRDCRGNAWVV